MTNEKDLLPTYRSYGKRWLVLLVVVLLNMTGAMVWLTFVAVAYKAIAYYDTSLFVINWLALVFNLCGVFIGPIATWVLERHGLKVALLLSAWLSCIGACLRIASTIDELSSSIKLVILFIGQTLVAIGQQFSMYSPAKMAATWFPEHQRALANTLGAVANPVGVVIAGVAAPLFVGYPSGELDVMNLLITMAVPVAFTALLTTITMTSKAPPQPPSAGALQVGGYFGKGLKKVFKNKNFMILVLTVGGGIGLYSTFATLLEQFLCPFGYTDTMAGICAAMMTGAGVVGAAIIGVVVGRTKQFSTMVKLCYVITTLGLIVFCVVFHIYMDYLILILIGGIGLFSFGIYPIGVELGVEATYPVGVATSSGLIMISGQIQSILLVLILQNIGRVMTPEELISLNSKCHSAVEASAPATTAAMTAMLSAGTEAPEVLQTLDLSVSVYVCGGYMGLMLLTLLIFFRPVYKRMAVELGRAVDMENSSSDDYQKEKDENSQSELSHEEYNLNKKAEFVSSL